MERLRNASTSGRHHAHRAVVTPSPAVQAGVRRASGSRSWDQIVTTSLANAAKTKATVPQVPTILTFTLRERSAPQEAWFRSLAKAQRQKIVEELQMDGVVSGQAKLVADIMVMDPTKPGGQFTIKFNPGLPHMTAVRLKSTLVGKMLSGPWKEEKDNNKRKLQDMAALGTAQLRSRQCTAMDLLNGQLQEQLARLGNCGPLEPGFAAVVATSHSQAHPSVRVEFCKIHSGVSENSRYGSDSPTIHQSAFISRLQPG